MSSTNSTRRNYRYTLRRSWPGGDGRILNFIMLNPSTADDVFDDATIRRCIGFAKRWGFSGIVVTNLFAFRATNPAELRKLRRSRAIGRENDDILREEAARAGAIVCAWGDHGAWLDRDWEVTARPLRGFTLLCIGTTARGNPLHPCRAKYTKAPMSFRAA